MAQDIFRLPIRFQYLLRRVKWFLDEAKVTGWAYRQLDGSPDKDHLELRVKGGRNSHFRRPTDEAPEELFNELRANPESDPSEICAGWKIPIFWFEPGLATKAKLADAWEMRGEFLSLNPVPSDLLHFLNTWGQWRNYCRHAWLSDILDSQQRWQKALLSPPEQWFPFVGWSHSITAKAGFPPFWVSTEGCITAIDTTITVDFLKGVRFAVCERPDCSGTKYFAMTSEHVRKYCSQYCGHIESVRRGRLAQRNSKKRK
jgi:hypothetical protein